MGERPSSSYPRTHSSLVITCAVQGREASLALYPEAVIRGIPTQAICNNNAYPYLNLPSITPGPVAVRGLHRLGRPPISQSDAML